MKQGQPPYSLFARLAGVALALLTAGTAAAHEIPTDATVHLMARPHGGVFQVVVRVPLNSMRDVEVPEFGPGYLDIEKLEPQLTELAAQWIAPFLEVQEDGVSVGLPGVSARQLSLPSNRSLVDFDSALAHLSAPLPENSENLIWGQLFFDVLLEYPIRSADSAFALRSGLSHLADSVQVVLRYQTPAGTERAYQFREDPGVLSLDPSWFQAVGTFVALGFEHILVGVDHLLFLFCLVIPLRNLRALVVIVTAFTAAHSITLISSAMGLAPDALWFPPLVEALIAASILYMALENILGTARRRWLFAFGFGLVHGFGFSFALQETMQFAGSHLLTSLLAFNVGVELGQLAVLVVLVPALAGFFRVVTAQRTGEIVLSAVSAHVAWHWASERVAVLWQYDIGGPGQDWSRVGLWAFAVAAVCGTGWLVWRRVQRPTDGVGTTERGTT